MPPRRSPRKPAAVVKTTTAETKKKAATVKVEANGTSKKVASDSKAAVATKTTTAARTEASKPARGKRKAVAPDVDYEEEDSAEEKVNEEEEDGDDKKPAKKVVKKQKTAKGSKAEENNAMPLTGRTGIGSLKKAMYIGAHISGAGGIHNSIQNALQIGANAFAVFLKSQRKWESPPLAPETRDQFISLCKKHDYDPARHCLPHGSYLVNLAQPDEEKADKAYGNFLDDLKRCDSLGIRLYNFHPGSALGRSKADAIARIAAQLNKSHRETGKVITVVENMAGSGNVVGSKFEDLRDIIELVEDKERVGVCIDTCHAFAAGYDLRTAEAFAETFAEFDRVVGYKYLRAFHLNDSKAPLGSNRDLHANIGTGFLGLRAFHSLMNHDRFQGLPMVLETPIDRKGPDGKTIEDKQVWADEIKLLESLIGMDPEGELFNAKEAELQKRGADERKRLQGQFDKKVAKVAKKTAPAKKRAKKKKKDETEDEASD